MKKILLLLYLLIFCSCINIHKRKDITWSKSKNLVFNRDKLQTGDIIIVKKKFDLYSFFGHSAIYIKDHDLIGEYPQIGYGFFYVPLDIWITEIDKRKIIVLRLKNIDDNFRKLLIEEIDKNSFKRYKIVLNKKRNDGYYCSQWVWKMFHEVALKKGYNLDLDGDGGVFVFPYDFLVSNKFDIVDISN